LLFFELSVCPSDSFLGLRFFFLSRWTHWRRNRNH
jgi:hypothetical protein